MAIVIVDQFTAEPIEPSLPYGAAATVLLTGFCALFMKRTKAVVDETTIRVHTMFGIQKIQFSDIQKITVRNFPARFILYGPHSGYRVKMPSAYTGTGEFISLLYKKSAMKKVFLPLLIGI
ncbi:hypothetical protein LQV63_02640 [Paenibacillus profundus]|uniref:PH domain-containing protein n=1 Tax=Paenibacillus profundus TaxID=1173085 RepID=A0ABS8YCI5_9BACL|nr:hypothetical protein [Paenibacillus profundus]